ncbi:MAG: CsbD family protein [Syntrophales bacterium]
MLYTKMTIEKKGLGRMALSGTFSQRGMNMNEDILKGKWLEITGGVKEKWGQLTGNDPGEIEGKGEKLLGLLQKKYGYIRSKSELEYEDSVELAEIVSSIRKIMTGKKEIMAIAFIARYGQPLLAKKQESQITRNREKQSPAPDRYFDTRLRGRNTRLALP